MLALQRRYGNRAVKNLVQPKLQVGPADDAYEREADRAAEQVMRGPVAATPPGDGGAVQRQAPPGHALLRASTAATHAGAGLVQRRSALVSAKTTTRQFKGPRTDNLDQDVVAVDKAPKGQSYSRLEPIDVYDAKHAHITDKAGAIAWFRIKSGKGVGEFIKGSKVIGGLAPGEAVPQEQGGSGQEMSGVDISGQIVGGVDSALIDVYRGATMEQAGDRTQSLAGITNSPQAQQNLEFAEGATWIGAGILGMAASVRDLMDKDKSGFDKLLASVALDEAGAGRVRAWLPEVNNQVVVGHFSLSVAEPPQLHFRYVQALPADAVISAEAVSDVLTLVAYTPVLFAGPPAEMAAGTLTLAQARAQVAPHPAS